MTTPAPADLRAAAAIERMVAGKLFDQYVIENSAGDTDSADGSYRVGLDATHRMAALEALADEMEG